MRELLTIAVDAVTARREIDAGADATIRISTDIDAQGRTVLELVDSGVGLVAAEGAELIATIGRSSKRDESLRSRAHPVHRAVRHRPARGVHSGRQHRSRVAQRAWRGAGNSLDRACRRDRRSTH